MVAIGRELFPMPGGILEGDCSSSRLWVRNNQIFKMPADQAGINCQLPTLVAVESQAQGIGEDRKQPVYQQPPEHDGPDQNIIDGGMPFLKKLVSRTVEFYSRTDIGTDALAL